MKRHVVAMVVPLLLTLFAFQWAIAKDFDHSLFDQILKRYVDDKGLIDYNGIGRDHRFAQYMDSLKGADPRILTVDGQLAFWINAYNALIIDKVIKRKPKKSVRETLIPGIWTSTKIFTSRKNVVANKKMSPDDIEHEILRKEFHDPRVHFAIVCASLGCPPLPRIAYTEKNVQARLEEEAGKYLNSSRGTRIDRAENTLFLSRIFDWFKSDFVDKSGSVMNFIRPYLRKEVLDFLERKPKIGFIHYDWSVNAKEPLK